MVSTLQSCRGTEIAGHLPTTRIIDEAHGRQVLVKNEAEVPLFKHEPNDRYWHEADMTEDGSDVCFWGESDIP